MTRPTTFQIGKTYATRSLCDYDCTFSFQVVRRTEKMITIRSHRGDVSRKVRLIDGVESIDPLGRFSMSPVLSADDLVDA